MPIVPKDLEGVSSHQFCALRFQRFNAEHGEKIRWLSMRPATLIASGARAAVAKLAVRINAGVAIRPEDG